MSDYSIIRFGNKEIKKFTKDLEKTKDNELWVNLFDSDKDGKVNLKNKNGESEINSLWAKLCKMTNQGKLTKEGIENAIASDESLAGLDAASVFGFMKKIAETQEAEKLGNDFNSNVKVPKEQQPISSLEEEKRSYKELAAKNISIAYDNAINIIKRAWYFIRARSRHSIFFLS